MMDIYRSRFWQIRMLPDMSPAFAFELHDLAQRQAAKADWTAYHVSIPSD